MALKIDQNRERFRDRTFCRTIRASHPQVHDVERLHSEVLQTDPVRFAAHDVNLYRYVFNSPPNLSDPNGTSPVYSDSCASDSDLGKIHTGSLSFATKVYPSGESPTRDAIKKIWDKVKPEGYPDADKIGKAVLGVEQMYGCFCSAPDITSRLRRMQRLVRLLHSNCLFVLDTIQQEGAGWRFEPNNEFLNRFSTNPFQSVIHLLSQITGTNGATPLPLFWRDPANGNLLPVAMT